MTHRPILAAAPNGAYKQKVDHPAIPLSLDEIVTAAVQAVQAGVSLLHLHIRDEHHQHSLEANLYRRTIEAIQNSLADQLIIQITSEAAGRYSPTQQINTIKTVNPDCVSIALRELIQDKSGRAAAQDLFHWCAEHACRAQYILYSEADLLNYFEYINEDIIPNCPHSVLFVLGRYAHGQQSSPDDLKPFLRHIDALNTPWMVCAFGAAEQLCMVDAAQKGGHLRVGFENNLLKTDGTIANSNFDQLKAIHHTINAVGSELATVTQARQILAIR